MNSKTENVMIKDDNVIANQIMHDINNIDFIERMYDSNLTSEDLFKIDCAILTTLRDTTDFSRDLLRQLEEGRFERVVVETPKTLDNTISEIQKDTMIDITLPLQNMFDEMTNYISEAFI